MVFKQLSPLKKLYKLLGKGQSLVRLGEGDLRHLYEQCGLEELRREWPKQRNASLIPTTVVATALQAAEIATATLTILPFGRHFSSL